MTIWMAMKRLNRHFDRWSAHAANHAVATLDQSGDPQQKPGGALHMSVWDLLSGNRRPRVSGAAKKE